jgi:hypothetical protein
MESAVEWQVNATRDEINMGNQDDLPIDMCEELEALEEMVMAQSQLIQQVKLELDDEEDMQESTLQRRSQPVD